MRKGIAMKIGYLDGCYEDGKMYRFGSVEIARDEILIIKGSYTYKTFKSQKMFENWKKQNNYTFESIF